jgi:hypothetical protein
MTDSPRQQWLGLSLLGAALALGLVVSALVGAHALTRIKLSHQTIEVKGYAEKRVTSDWAVWMATFSVRTPALAASYRTLSEQRTRVLAFLESQGLSAKGVAMAAVDVVTEHRRDEKGEETDEVTGYRLTQGLSVSTGDVLLVDQVSRESSALLGEGIEFQSDAPACYCTKLDDLKLAMSGPADVAVPATVAESAPADVAVPATVAESAPADVAVPATVAESATSGTGGRVGALASASQGVFQITPVHSTEVSDYGKYDTSTIEKAVKASVTVEYSLH